MHENPDLELEEAADPKRLVIILILYCNEDNTLHVCITHYTYLHLTKSMYFAMIG